MDDERCVSLRARIADLKSQLADLEAQLAAEEDGEDMGALPMRLSEYRRYGRQMILKDIGLPGQLALRSSRVLVVGAGGLGCPALLYLAGAGVGRIGIVDHDTVELSNLHRQVLHTQSTIGTPKALSARAALLERNSQIDVVAYVQPFASELLESYDLVLDCTDNAATRHQINLACVDAGLPLVSGAAIRTDGQLSVFNLPGASCYACVFPPTVEDATSQRCENEGVLGPVTGVIGTLMALDAIRVIVGSYDATQPRLTLYNATSPSAFRSVKLRGKKADCSVCGVRRPLPDFICAMPEPTQADDRIEASALRSLLDSSLALIDVRPAPEFGICSLPRSQRLELKTVLRDPEKALDGLQATDLIVLCRRGNDSLLAARAIRAALPNARVRDLEGGLAAYAQAERSFPMY